MGLGTFSAFGKDYLPGAAAMASTIALLVVFDSAHRPDVSTSLVLSFRTHREDALLVFSLAVAIVVVLYFVQRAAVALLRKIGGRPWSSVAPFRL